MKTLSITEARANLSKCCEAAIGGQEVAILHNGRLLKLSPVNEVAELSDAEALPNLDALLAARGRKKARRTMGLTEDEARLRSGFGRSGRGAEANRKSISC